MRDEIGLALQLLIPPHVVRASDDFYAKLVRDCDAIPWHLYVDAERRVKRRPQRRQPHRRIDGRRPLPPYRRRGLLVGRRPDATAVRAVRRLVLFHGGQHVRPVRAEVEKVEGARGVGAITRLNEGPVAAHSHNRPHPCRLRNVVVCGRSTRFAQHDARRKKNGGGHTGPRRHPARHQRRRSARHRRATQTRLPRLAHAINCPPSVRHQIIHG